MCHLGQHIQAGLSWVVLLQAASQLSWAGVALPPVSSFLVISEGTATPQRHSSQDAGRVLKEQTEARGRASGLVWNLARDLLKVAEPGSAGTWVHTCVC